MSTPTSFKLNTGASIPAIGLGKLETITDPFTSLTVPGTWQARPGQVGDAVQHALKSGYRHLDCALIYQNGPFSRSYMKSACIDNDLAENEVGEAIKKSGVPRDELFITSKA